VSPFSRLCRLIGRFALVAAALLLTPPLHAEPRELVTVAVSASESDARAFEVVLRELMARLPVDLEFAVVARVDPAEVVTPPPDRPPRLARVWVDASRTDVAVVYLADSEWERILVRRVALSGTFDEVSREQIAHIVEGSVEALRAGARIGIEREAARVELGVQPAPKPAAKAAPPPQPETPVAKPAQMPPPNGAARARLRVALGYGALLFTPSEILHGPLGRADLDFGDPTWRYGGALDVQYRLPIRTAADPIGLSYESFGVRAAATLRRRLDRLTALGLELGGGFDYERIASRGLRGTGALVLTPAESRVSPALRAGVGVDLALFGSTVLSVLGVLDFALAPRDFVAQTGGATEVVLSPLSVRPGAFLAIGTPLVGSP
jgi:hypothetical protein